MSNLYQDKSMRAGTRVVALDVGITVFVDTSRLSHCKGCGEPIYWATTDRGKKMPINHDFEKAHFATCSKSDSFRKQQGG